MVDLPRKGVLHERPFTHEGNYLINFVKEMDPMLVSMVKLGRGILTATNDWLLLIDLETQLMFQQEIALTDLRPDLVIWSRKANTVMVGELTVPWEDNIELHSCPTFHYTVLRLMA